MSLKESWKSKVVLTGIMKHDIEAALLLEVQGECRGCGIPSIIAEHTAKRILDETITYEEGGSEFGAALIELGCSDGPTVSDVGSVTLCCFDSVLPDEYRPMLANAYPGIESVARSPYS